MNGTTTLLLLMTLQWGAGVAAREKFAGTWYCGKPEQLHAIPAPDRLNHSFSVCKLLRTALKPDQIAGLRPTSDERTRSSDALGDREHFRTWK